MATRTTIEWTEETWNPTAGCTKVSPGCKNCYAETMAVRLHAMGVRGYENGFNLTLLPSRLQEPLKRKKPTIYFVNSMSDLFHERIPEEYIQQVFGIVERAPQHVFQILTKRADRMAAFCKSYPPPRNAWLGVTVEDRKHGLPRLNILLTIKARVRFLSMEPLLEDIGELDLTDIDWVIVGGESGPKARPMKPEWAINIQKQCQQNRVAFFFKQWGGWGADGKKRPKKSNGRMLDGRIWNELPALPGQTCDSQD